ncbi:MAG: MoxR family ATPase [Planctomycetota bacterium]|jgi:MoxR-like ATPase|nr:MoxR family ATPase [Planctomycetota bacterium]
MSQTESTLESAEIIRDGRERMNKELRKVFKGQTEAVDLLLMTILARGHCLIEGVPGLGKTLLVNTMANLQKMQFHRIQFTPDLMPSDIIGTEVMEEDVSTGRRESRFIRGPLFANVILADEINRTPPKTQAALLEAMQEKHVTAGGETRDLPLPFIVCATQNPIEQEGTYPLPEAELDRFMFKIILDYPSADDEYDVAAATTVGKTETVEPIFSGEEVLKFQDLLFEIPLSPHVIRYAVNLSRATRPAQPDVPEFVRNWVEWGASTRAVQNLLLGGKAHALLQGRENVSCEDVRSVALPVMRHRVLTNFEAEADNIRSDDIVNRLVEEVPEPSERDY